MAVGRVGIVGLGTMGAGIAQVCVMAGVPTVGLELTPALAERGRRVIGDRLSRLVEKGELEPAERDAAMARLRPTTELRDLADCELVIEAVVEKLAVKRETFAALGKVVGADTVLATNTSALPVSEIAASAPNPARVVGLHFFNPAPVLPLVEVVRAEGSSAAAVAIATEFVEQIGKTPIVCRDTPGFVVNRLLIPMLNDAVRLLEDEVASAEDIDAAMRLGTRWPIGPLALIDLVGVDVHVHAAEALHRSLGEPRLAPPDRLRRMVERGELGRKTGRGFYSYG